MKPQLSLFLLATVLIACTRSTRSLTETATPAQPTVTTGVTAEPVTESPDSLIPPGQILVLSLESGGEQRSYWLYLPTTYSPETPVPLVIDFHGFGADAPGEQALSGMSFLAETKNFIVAYPNGLDHQWFDVPNSRDVTFTRELILEIEAQYAIDSNRIFVTGMSNGGGMANRVGCELADVVAAIGPVAGAYNLWQRCDSGRPMPVIAFHGLDDKVVPFEGGSHSQILPPIYDWAAAWANRNGCSSTPTITLQTADVTGQTWSGCSAEVVLYSIANHGHSWPGSRLMATVTSQALDATRVMWEFFQAHPLP